MRNSRKIGVQKQSVKVWNIDYPESILTISAKTIYQYCYSAWWQSLCNHLYQKRYQATKYKKSWEWWVHGRQLIPERVWIDERPEIINTRSRIWDTESDFIVSVKWDPTVMLTNLDRKSRYVQAKKLGKRSCKTTNTAIKKVLSTYPTVYSLTLDNDILFQHHMEIRDDLWIQTYFCHPYHSWEKGQIEYANRMIRRYIPKKSLLANISQKKIDKILEMINNTPRKCLGWKTPIQVLQESGIAIEGKI